MAMTATELFFDRAAAIAMLDGDEPLFAEMVEVFLAECPVYCQGLETAQAAGDAETLQREAHTVKSVLAAFGCESGRALAERLEQQAAAGDATGTGPLTAEVIAVVGKLAAALVD